jgi:hypothetical protein
MKVGTCYDGQSAGVKFGAVRVGVMPPVVAALMMAEFKAAAPPTPGHEAAVAPPVPPPAPPAPPAAPAAPPVPAPAAPPAAPPVAPPPAAPPVAAPPAAPPVAGAPAAPPAVPPAPPPLPPALLPPVPVGLLFEPDEQAIAPKPLNATTKKKFFRCLDMVKIPFTRRSRGGSSSRPCRCWCRCRCTRRSSPASSS